MRTWILLGLAACMAGASAAELEWDVLMLRNGGTQSCRILAIASNGRVQFVKPEGGGRIVLPAVQLRGMRLAGADIEKVATHTLVLRNGDRLAGELLELGAEFIEFRSRLLGDLKVRPRDVVAIRRIAAPQEGVLEKDFAVGGLAPWKGEAGHWTLGAGGVYAVVDPKQSYARRVLVAPLKHEGAVEIEVRIDTTHAFRPNFRIALCTVESTGPAPKLGLYADFASSRWSVSGTIPTKRGYEGIGRVAHSGYGPGTTGFKLPPRGVFRLTYDPDADVVIVWADGKRLGEGRCNRDMYQHKPTHVRLECGDGVRVEYVYAGPLRKSPPPVPQAQKDHDVIQLASGDLLPCTSMTIEDDRLVVKSAAGGFEFPMDKVVCIIPRTAGRPATRVARSVVYMRTARSALTLQLRGMNSDWLQGRSAILRDLRIARGGITTLMFLARPPRVVPSRGRSGFRFPAFQFQ